MKLRCQYCQQEFADDESVSVGANCPVCGKSFGFSPEETLDFDGSSTLIEPAETPAFVSRYRVLNEIGVSAASRVYRAHDTELDRLVALKLSRFESPDHRPRFTNEHKIVSKLRHRYIVSVLDYGFENDREFVVSELIQGVSLRTWPARNDLLPAEIADLCEKLAEALTHAHERNIVHRDLKPANILIDIAGRPRIVDFGVAFDLRARGESTLGQLIGTPAYMAPEQTRRHYVDGRTDIYALGVIMYELLAGRRPHDGANVHEILQRIEDEEPRPLDASIPTALSGICRRCLAKDPDDRFQSARDLARALRVYLASGDRELVELAEELRRLRLKNADLQREASARARMFIASQSEHQLYQALVEDLPLCVIRKDLEGRFQFANEAFCQTIGCPFEELRAKTSADIFSPRLAESHAEAERHVISTGRATDGVEEYEIAGEVRTFEVKRSPIRNFDAEIVGIQAIMWDVSAHAHAERALREAKDAAVAANQAKNNFLANISHEIRTPMQAVIGLTDLLLGRKQDEENTRSLRLVHRSATALLTIINEILDYSSIEAGRLTLRQAPFDLHTLVNDVAALFEHEASDKRLLLHCEIAEDVPRAFSSDATRIRQILMNLVRNALKFTARGSIALRLFLEAGERSIADGNSDDELIPVHFVVSDTGKGVPPNKQDGIFEAFTQEDESITRQHGGTGLGLAICSELVELIGGRIWLESEVGRGSDFHVILNLRVCEETPEPSAAKPAGGSRVLRVLLVEDHEINQEFASMSLRSMGHTVAIASNGREALDAFAVDKYDVVLMDLQMPEMDGRTAAEEIRRREAATSSRVPIIAISAHATEADRQQCLDAGMDGYLCKPISPGDLFNELERVARDCNAAPEGEPLAPTTFQLERLKRRIANDNEFLEKMFAMFKQDRPIIERKVDAAIQSEDAEQFAKALHELLGLVRNFNAIEAADAIIKLKSKADSDWNAVGPDWAVVRQRIDAFEEELGSVVTNERPHGS